MRYNRGCAEAFLQPWSFLPSQKNSSQASDILAAVSQTLSKYPVDFGGAKILSGQDEGAFGWITINYVLGMLLKVHGPPKGEELA